MDIFDTVDDLAIEEERQLVNYLNPLFRNIRERPDNLALWDDKEFWKRFRLRKDTVICLLSLIEEKIKHKTERNNCVPPMQQLLLTLRFYATGSFYITVGDFGGLHNSTLCQIVKRVTEAISSMRKDFVYLPRSREEILSIQEGFYNISRFPRVIAALDCTHIRIISPGVCLLSTYILSVLINHYLHSCLSIPTCSGGDTAENFRNRKGYFSLNVQAMCTSDLKFLDIVTRWPGATHDSLIFSNSAAKYQCDNGAFGNGIVLGDSGYFLNNYLLTPLSNPLTQAEHLYNESHIRSRNVIERCFGVWKRRFPVLSIGIRCKISLAQDIIVAASILHNLACSRNEGEPPIDPDVQPPPQPLFAPLIAEVNEETPSSTRQIMVEYFNSLT